MFGLDAFDHALMDNWIEDGTLPNFRRLKEHAKAWTLTGSTNVLQGSIWPSFATSTDPGHHAMYFSYQSQAGNNRLARMQALDLKARPFWSPLDSQGKKSLIIDVPKLGLSAGLNGVQVVEFGAMDHYAEFSTQPHSLAQQIRKRFGEHILLQPFKRPAGQHQETLLTDKLCDGVQQKLDLTQWLIERHQPDLCVSVFGEAHAAGHYLWGHGNGQGDSPGAAVHRVYRKLDDAVGSLLDKYADSANLMFYSGHGMAPDHRPHWIVDELLVHLGFMKTRSGKRPAAAYTNLANQIAPRHVAVKRIETRLKQLINQYAPRAITNQIHIMLQRRGNIDFERSVAWSLPTDHQGFVRINLKGREPYGLVSPEQYETTLSNIADELAALKNAQTGVALIENVYKLWELYPGAPRLNLLPDLALDWRNEPVSEVVTRSGHRFAISPQPGNFRVANHQLSGFCFGLGPGFKATASQAQADLMDLGVTALELLGVSASAALKGRSLLR
jgi:predicted AlkP superfamily phosphohydrolase/phosphomutase